MPVIPAIITQQKRDPASSPGPPFAAASANNGLSVDSGTGKIVLGNNLSGSDAMLLSDREIPLSGHGILLSDLISGLNTSFNPGVISVYDTTGFNNAFIQVDSANSYVSIQGDDTAGVLPHIEFINASGVNWFAGDDNSVFKISNFDAVTGVYKQWFNVSLGTLVTEWGDIGGQGKSVKIANDANNGVIKIGDPDKVGVMGYLAIDGSGATYPNAQLFSFYADNIAGTDAHLEAKNDLGKWLDLVIPSSISKNDMQFRVGDLDGQANNCRLSLSDSGSSFSVQIASAPVIQLCNKLGNEKYQFGDISGYNNAGFMEFDYVARLAKFDNVTHDLKLSINGIAGFTGTVTPVNSITVVGGIVTNVT